MHCYCFFNLHSGTGYESGPDLSSGNCMHDLFSYQRISFRFLSLVKAEDGEQYSKTAFLGARIENFKLIILTQLWKPSEDLINQTYPLRVMIPSKSF
jgi:hypothetical protein